jgi:predicted GH43/DUF377 family glycosyl hydrolase
MVRLEAYSETHIVVLARSSPLLSNPLLRPDPKRTVIRPFAPGDAPGFEKAGESRAQRTIERIRALGPGELALEFARLKAMLERRHRHVEAILLRRFEELDDPAIKAEVFSLPQKMLIGGYFSAEYSFEAAALFNPSIARHWDQEGVPEGGVRFVLSLRGIGEGHVSSVTFRTGTWLPGREILLDEPSRYAMPPSIAQAPGEDDGALRVTFDDIEDVSEAVLFPMAPSQRQGIEDLRLVEFSDPDGEPGYFGTYTAFSGSAIRSEILRTRDFRSFDMRPLGGRYAGNKGMALFPRKIAGRYAMLGRQDNENIWLLMSDDLNRWDEAEKTITPRWPWEFIQIGNCGSPIEIDEGWLTILHGVGMVRNYTIGACLLDKTDPTKVLARTARPLLYPTSETRDGYVPNVVYSCGSLLHSRQLLLPYGVADNFATFASVSIDELLGEMN